MFNRQFLPRLKPWVSLSNVMKEYKEYEVYYIMMRDAQVYTGSAADYENMPEEEREKLWKDIDQDMLVDIVFATDENDAVRVVAENEGCNPDALYAMEHLVESVNNWDNDFKTDQRTVAYSVNDDDEFGIKVLFNNGKELFVGQDKESGKIIVKEL